MLFGHCYFGQRDKGNQGEEGGGAVVMLMFKLLQGSAEEPGNVVSLHGHSADPGCCIQAHCITT
jgi:hypothetical protein